MQSAIQISPLKQNRKRTRITDDQEPFYKEMDLDDFSNLYLTTDVTNMLRFISDLNLEELKIAQEIAKEKIKSVLFLDLESPNEPVGSNPFLDQKFPQENMYTDSVKIVGNQVNSDFRVNGINSQHINRIH